MVRLSKKYWTSFAVVVSLVTLVSAVWLSRQNDIIDHTIAPPGKVATDSRYPWHSVVGTVFWVGEDETADNAYINNRETAWDLWATETFGGVDDPLKRTADGLQPQAFTPKHNPFYMALPAAEFNKQGVLPEARQKSYWPDQALVAGESLFKGRWAEVYYQGKTVYVQWVDVGPFEEYDYDYVFGHNKPKNAWGKGAGIDLSPAAAHVLGVNGVGDVFWRFVDASSVPDGPWQRYPAITNKTNWTKPSLTATPTAKPTATPIPKTTPLPTSAR